MTMTQPQCDLRTTSLWNTRSPHPTGGTEEQTQDRSVLKRPALRPHPSPGTGSRHESHSGLYMACPECPYRKTETDKTGLIR